MTRSLVTVDLRALRRNARRLRDAAGPADLWAVVKANGYGHGAVDVARVSLGEGAAALCVATLAEAAELRAALPEARILVLGGLEAAAVAAPGRCARGDGVERAAARGAAVHLKVDTGMGRWGLPLDRVGEVDLARSSDS